MNADTSHIELWRGSPCYTLREFAESLSGYLAERPGAIIGSSNLPSGFRRVERCLGIVETVRREGDNVITSREEQWDRFMALVMIDDPIERPALVGMGPDPLRLLRGLGALEDRWLDELLSPPVTWGEELVDLPLTKVPEIARIAPTTLPEERQRIVLWPRLDRAPEALAEMKRRYEARFDASRPKMQSPSLRIIGGDQ
jgi:hypothetical protein